MKTYMKPETCIFHISPCLLNPISGVGSTAGFNTDMSDNATDTYLSRGSNIWDDDE